jgi:hypothetical protein
MAIVVVLVALGTLGTHAQGQPKPQEQPKEDKRPLKSWGPLRAIGTIEGDAIFYFEDQNGTIRLYDASLGSLRATLERQ